MSTQDVVQFNQQIDTEHSHLRADSVRPDPDQEFAPLLDNKSVVLVGPSSIRSNDFRFT